MTEGLALPSALTSHPIAGLIYRAVTNQQNVVYSRGWRTVCGDYPIDPRADFQALVTVAFTLAGQPRAHVSDVAFLSILPDTKRQK